MNPFTTPGAFSWTELHTTDPEAATAFYKAVFGWKTDVMEMAMGPYTVIQVGHDAGVGGIMQRPDENAPPHWGLFVTVEGIDNMLPRATELGGTALSPVMDIPSVGRIAAIQDPQGAVIMLVEYESKPEGPDIDFGHYFVTNGAFSWFELTTPDLDGSIEFYGGLFGWTVKIDTEMGMGPYGVIHLGDVMIGGMSGPMSDEMPPAWGPYVTVESADEAAEKATAAGGTLIVPPMDIPTVGRFTGIQDPQGAVLMAIAYSTEGLESASQA